MPKKWDISVKTVETHKANVLQNSISNGVTTSCVTPSCKAGFRKTKIAIFAIFNHIKTRKNKKKQIPAGGLAVASGDVILGWRAVVNIFFSCALAIGFAMLLVVLLPFKEVTNEIASRTSPNTLDLFIALFSGATGAIAISKEVKGVATSIPGVAIAVALMPPLDAIGFGFGIAATGDAAQGLNIARGGGLLILTNLVAIIFSAMLVFLALRVNTESTTKKVRDWRKEDDESLWTKYFLARFPGFDKLRTIGSLPGRFLLIFVPLLLISVPLYESFSQLKNEIVLKQKQNRIKNAAEERRLSAII